MSQSRFLRPAVALRWAVAAIFALVAGNWVYRDTHYVWRPGFWYAYRPGWVYIPAHYAWTPYGYIFMDGYWEGWLPDGEISLE